MNVARIDGAAARRAESGFRIRRDRENDITLISGNSESRTRVSTYRNTDISEYFAELVQLLEIDHRSGRGCGINRDGTPTTLRKQRDTQHFDADGRPIFR